MRRVDLYLETDSACVQSTHKKYGYVLECETPAGTRTRESFGEITAGWHKATLAVIAEAGARMREPCEIHIHTQDAYVLNMMKNSLPSWAKNHFKTTRGKLLTNWEGWEELWKLSQIHLLVPEPGRHAYTDWMKGEMKGHVAPAQQEDKDV